ncbi:MAG: RDD family protein [Planctomycetaceae bacterium]
MPIKVRCRGCEKVLNAPDKAMGKVIQCPNCGTKLKIPSAPAGGASASDDDAPSAPRPKKPAAKPKGPAPKSRKPQNSGDGDGFLGNLDIDNFDLEDEESQICPYCAADMDEEEEVCRKCGMNVVTGQKDEKVSRKLARRGPDPDKFWSEAWKDPWEFTLKYKPLVWRTARTWTLFLFIALSSLVIPFIWNLPGTESAPAPVAEGEVVREDALAEVPVAWIFWGAVSGIFGLGVTGWYWALSLKIIQATMAREEINTDRVHVDMFDSLALGFRTVFWPYVMMAPALPFILPFAIVFSGAFVSVTEINGPVAVQIFFSSVFLITLAVCAAVIYPFFPQSLVHMSTSYRFKAWILWEQMKILVKNFPATLYWWLVAVAVHLPFVILLVLGVIYASPLIKWYVELIAEAVAWMLGEGGVIEGTLQIPGLWFRLVLIMASVFIVLPMVAILAIAMAFPSVFTMRLTGLYGYYRRETLDLVTNMKRGTVAGFWVRFLARMIDVTIIQLFSMLTFGIWQILVRIDFPMGIYFGAMALAASNLVFASIAGAKSKQAPMVSILLGVACMISLIFASAFGQPLFALFYLGFSIILSLYNYWMYFVINEASTGRSTIGKEAFGLEVQKIDGAQLDVKEASLRHLGRFLSDILFSIPYVIAAFSPTKQAMHDSMAKTQVVFRGDRD